MNIAKQSRFLDLKKGDIAPFTYGGFIFKGRLTKKLSHDKKEIATMVYDQPGFVFPSIDPLYVEGEGVTSILSFSPLNGIGVLESNNYLGYLLKKMKTTEDGKGISHLHYAINNESLIDKTEPSVSRITERDYNQNDKVIEIGEDGDQSIQKSHTQEIFQKVASGLKKYVSGHLFHVSDILTLVQRSCVFF